MTKEAGCSFCEPGIKDQPHFARYGKGRIDLVPLVETSTVVVYPDILPVSPDGLHMLLIPKEHKYSLAAHPDLAEEVSAVLQTLEQITGQQLVIFEHGGVHDGGKNQSVYHQHAHICTSGGHDVVGYMEEVLQTEGIVYEEVIVEQCSPIANLQRLFKGVGYFYMQQGEKGIIAHDTGDSFPSQIMQRNMSRLLSGRELNWKNIPDDDELAELSVTRIARLVDLFQHGGEYGTVAT